jgi:RecA-family ATPase
MAKHPFTEGNPMSEQLEFNKEKFADGEAGFMRGLSVAQLVEGVNKEVAEPPESDGQWQQSREAQAEALKQRESNGMGMLLGYLNGVAQAIRRIDQQLMLPPEQG